MSISNMSETMAPEDSFDIQEALRREPSHDEIAALAYEYWLQRDKQAGSPEEDWFKAEESLRATASSDDLL